MWTAWSPRELILANLNTRTCFIQPLCSLEPAYAITTSEASILVSGNGIPNLLRTRSAATKKDWRGFCSGSFSGIQGRTWGWILGGRRVRWLQCRQFALGWITHWTAWAIGKLILADLDASTCFIISLGILEPTDAITTCVTPTTICRKSIPNLLRARITSTQRRNTGPGDQEDED